MLDFAERLFQPGGHLAYAGMAIDGPRTGQVVDRMQQSFEDLPVLFLNQLLPERLYLPDSVRKGFRVALLQNLHPPLQFLSFRVHGCIP